MNENHLFYQFITKNIDKGVMFDVGADFGSTCINYAKKGWIAHAFEPKKKFCDILKNTKNIENLKIFVNQKCVGDRELNDMDFYISNVSEGISSLTNFHNSHILSDYKVDIIRLDNYIIQNNIQDVEFIKIDTEGYDLFVLKGFPFNKIKPKYILCEFEDLKSQDKLDYIWEDQANFLYELGYKIIVSEWYPIVKYGGNHKWNKLHRYPCKLNNINSWGNFFCIRDDIDLNNFIEFLGINNYTIF